MKGPNWGKGALVFQFIIVHWLSTCTCSPASDFVRCIRTAALKMWTIDKLKTAPFPQFYNTGVSKEKDVLRPALLVAHGVYIMISRNSD